MWLENKLVLLLMTNTQPRTPLQKLSNRSKNKRLFEDIVLHLVSLTRNFFETLNT